MKLNCKPGDLAIVIAGNKSSGRIVRVSHLISRGTLAPTKTGEWFEIGSDDMWILSEGSVFRSHPKAGVVETEYADDKYLRPILPGDGEDETLTWAGKPEEVTA